jgi:hypothetical protein
MTPRPGHAKIATTIAATSSAPMAYSAVLEKSHLKSDMFVLLTGRRHLFDGLVLAGHLYRRAAGT